jgi:hypothetical protein
MRTRTLVLVALAAGTILGLAACGSSPSSSSGNPPVAKGATSSSTSTTVPFVSATCTENTTSTAEVQCELPDVSSRPYFELSTLLSEAQAAAPSLGITSSSPMVITAFGGVGGHAYTAGAGSAGNPGSGGEAEDTTTVADYTSAYGTPVLFYYLGAEGVKADMGGIYGGVGGLGGASTIVSPENLTIEASPLTLACIENAASNQYDESGCSSTNVVEVAGGGGGGGEGATCDGGSGGSGGTAVSSTSAVATGSGNSGGDGGCSGGHGGHGGDLGTAGGGGSGGDGLNNHGGGGGNNGVGGLGGAVHTSNGPSDSIPWANVGYCLYELGNSGSSTYPCPVTQSSPSEWGAGGEGEWRGSTQPLGGGGGGGGGWGGGGGGGGGGNSDPGGGGGGGGSFAAGSGTSPGTFTAPSNPGGDGSVWVTFVS